jgi:hypothetical protein
LFFLRFMKELRTKGIRAKEKGSRFFHLKLMTS